MRNQPMVVGVSTKSRRNIWLVMVDGWSDFAFGYPDAITLLQELGMAAEHKSTTAT
jgi:hypothetical protein